MIEHKKLAFIGAGNMAYAIISGLIKNGYPPSHIIAVNKNNARRRETLRAMGVTVETTDSFAIQHSEVIILAVKPQIMAELCQSLSHLDFSNKWVLSVAAGISTDRLSQLLPTATNIIRLMPNTPAIIGAGITGLFAKKSVDPTACQFAEQLLSAIGQCYWVENEAQLNKIIAITGSSPAYFFRFMEAMQQSAMQMGFSEQDARLLVQSAALGATKLVEANSELSLATLRENVTSKGGTTAEALAIFEQHHLADTVDQAMWAAIHRAEEMEKSL